MTFPRPAQSQPGTKGLQKVCNPADALLVQKLSWTDFDMTTLQQSVWISSQEVIQDNFLLQMQIHFSRIFVPSVSGAVHIRMTP